MTVAERPWLAQIRPYQPGRSADSADGSMASNESPIGASPNVAAAIAASVGRVHRYPDPLADRLRAELASVHGLDPEQILVGNGSDELIYLLAWAYLAHGGRVVCADPGYQTNEISSRVADAQLAKVPLRDWRHDLEAMAQVEADIAYVVNPHNPTGTIRSGADIADFVATSPAGLVVVDEAYIDFADDPVALTALPLARAGKAAVLRTFSKIHGLAGLRVGYLVADRDVISTLRKIRAPFSVGSLAQAGALAALQDQDHTRQVREHTLRLRGEVAAILVEAGLTVVPSQANFVLAQTSDEAALVAELATRGISVRPGSALGVPGTVRVSVPSERGVELLRNALLGSAKTSGTAAVTTVK